MASLVATSAVSEQHRGGRESEACGSHKTHGTFPDVLSSRNDCSVTPTLDADRSSQSTAFCTLASNQAGAHSAASAVERGRPPSGMRAR